MFAILGSCVLSLFSTHNIPTLTTFYRVLLNNRHVDAETSRAPSVTCFSIVFLLSLMGAAGLTIRATSGNGFCEEFLSAHPEKCREAVVAVAMSWTSVVIGELHVALTIHDLTLLSNHSAYAGISVSLLDEFPGAMEWWSAREIRQQSQSGPTNISPRIHIPRPPPASYMALRPRGLHHTQGPTQPVPVLPGHSQRFPSYGAPSSLSSPPLSRENEPASFVLNRKIRGPVGQAPRNEFTWTDNLQALPDNVLNPAKRSTQKVDERDMWKQKYLV